jgi:hypothetical protein
MRESYVEIQPRFTKPGAGMAVESGPSREIQIPHHSRPVGGDDQPSVFSKPQELPPCYRVNRPRADSKSLGGEDGGPTRI